MRYDFRMPIDRFVIDSSDAITELCQLGRDANTDKSPYNFRGKHRHPYTGVYTILLAGLKRKALRFAEIGVAGGNSCVMWDLYFENPAAKLSFYDRDQNFLDHAQSLTQDRVAYGMMDVEVDGDVERALREKDPSGEGYDVILDDSSHNFDHQIRIIHEAFPLLKKGGMLIVEDIFRNASEEEYEAKLGAILPQCDAAYFVMCEHKDRWSPGWDNDKLLILVKG